VEAWPGHMGIVGRSSRKKYNIFYLGIIDIREKHAEESIEENGCSILLYKYKSGSFFDRAEYSIPFFTRRP